MKTASAAGGRPIGEAAGERRSLLTFLVPRSESAPLSDASRTRGDPPSIISHLDKGREAPEYAQDAVMAMLDSGSYRSKTDSPARSRRLVTLPPAVSPRRKDDGRPRAISTNII
ncbi:hypothetical protein GCM10020221_15220 [Streptomyces thioluteus]|uniref:Uncharacterized protein n=1 Tax=Streptomyces thioluteus TaxID=66431 RepID=A0ABP6J3P2_STRTU